MEHIIVTRVLFFSRQTRLNWINRVQWTFKYQGLDIKKNHEWNVIFIKIIYKKMTYLKLNF
jgi:hypothetical protein